VIFLGAGIKPGNYRQKIAVNDIAPTLAELLGVELPAGSIGRVLTEILE
jgi:arylsulfatase A-like enzyme